jgi:3-methyladenine DNA glycosylase Mpg
VDKSPAAQWGVFMQCIAAFVILGAPYFAIDTVWLLTTWAFHIIKKMLGMPSTATARIQSVQSTIHSRFISLTNRIKNAWALLQHNLVEIVDFCNKRFQSSSHYGWLVPILVILVIFEPRLIFSDLIPSRKVTCSEWTSCMMRLLITRSTTLMSWARGAWTTMQSTVFSVSSLTGWALGVVVLIIISGARYGWLSTQSLKRRVSSLTISVLNTAITWTTAGTRALLSATGSMNRVFTSATTRAPNAQRSWLRIQAQDDDDGEDDSASCLSSISRTVGQCTKPVLQTIVKWVLLVTPTTETGSFWSTLLQMILKISLIAGLISTIILPFIKWIKGVPSPDQRESVSLLQERDISISDISGISEPYYNDILLAEDSTYQLLVQLPGSRLGEDNSNEQDSSGSISQQEESNSDSDNDSQASDISSSVSLTPSARLIMAEVAAIERGNQSLVREHPARYTKDSDSSQTSGQEMRTILTNGPGSLCSSLGDLSLISFEEESSDDSSSDSEASDINSSVSLTPSARFIMAEVAAIEKGNQPMMQDHPVRFEEDPDISQTSGQEMMTILTNGPGSLYPSLDDLPLITPKEESHDDSDSDSEASDISSSASLTPSARFIMAEVATMERSNQSLAQEHPVRHEDNVDNFRTSGQKMKTFLTNGPSALHSSLGVQPSTAPEEDEVKQNSASYSSIPQSRDPPRVKDSLEEILQLQQTPSQATERVPDHQTRPSTAESDPDDDAPDNLPNNVKNCGNLNEDSNERNFSGPPSQQEESNVLSDSDSNSEASDSSSSVSLTPSAWLIQACNQAVMLEHLVRHEEDPDILQTSGQEIKTFLTNVPEEATVKQSPVSYSSTPLYRDPPRERQNMKEMLQIYQAPSQATS